MSTSSGSRPLGHEGADEAHRQLDEFADLARQALAMDNGEVMLHALRSLFAHSGEHFAWEERLMVETAYPDAQAHRESHAAFMTELRGIVQEVEKLGLTPRLKLWYASRFMDWMKFHVQRGDAHLIRHVRLQQEAAAAAAPLPAPPRP